MCERAESRGKQTGWGVESDDPWATWNGREELGHTKAKCHGPAMTPLRCPQ